MKKRERERESEEWERERNPKDRRWNVACAKLKKRTYANTGTTKNESGGKTTKRGQTKKKGERETEKQNWKVKFCKKNKRQSGPPWKVVDPVSN
jgi:hypothetical protein